MLPSAVATDPKRVSAWPSAPLAAELPVTAAIFVFGPTLNVVPELPS